jgi:alginate O-acetyltransferase complex protein AlgI
MSYTIDIYRKNLKPAKTFLDFALFVAFFPQLVAGPIVRAVEFIPQLDNPIRIRKRNIAIGLQIFLTGFIKKLLIADRLAIYVDSVFQAPELFSSISIWGAIVAYSIQIFCDFSGYSDMAVGIAKMMGFDLPLNFKMPYISLNITEFWRRWHLSLSFWLRDYLYISLGGNRCGKFRQSANLIITMLLGGLWHGASWNFVVWGGLHGVALFFHKFYSAVIPKNIKENSVYRVFSWAATYLFVLYCWVFFRAETFSDSFLIIKRMTYPVFSEGLEKYVYLPFLIILPFIILMHLVGKFWKYDDRYYLADLRTFKGAFLVTLSLFLLFFFSPLNTSPFIYFQF